MPLDRIERKDVSRWFDRYSTMVPDGINKVLEVMCQLLNHAKVHGLFGTNPAGNIRHNPTRIPLP